MGKNQHSKDRLFITRTEWQRDYGGKKQEREAQYRPLPFDCCALTFTPFKNPVCTPEGTVFDVLNIVPYVRKHGRNPVSGEPLALKELIKLHFAKNADGKYHCPVTFKVFNEHSHIVAVRPTGNVFSFDAVNELNIRTKNFTDLLSGEPFKRKDIITIQDPHQPEKNNISNFYHVRSGDSLVPSTDPSQNIRASGTARRVLEKLAEVEKKRAATESSGDGASAAARPVKRSRYTPAQYSGSLTSTAVAPMTSSEHAAASEEELNKERWLRAKIKRKHGYVRLRTNLGVLNLELLCEYAPRTCENFLKLCASGYYDGVIFHRNIRHFMIQGGDPTGTGRGGQSTWGKSFPDEFHNGALHSSRGVLSMANSGPSTNGSQFFITYKSCSHLDYKHTVFGRLVGGGETLDRMEAVPTGDGDRPTTDIRIETAEVVVDPFEEVDAELEAEAQREEEEAKQRMQARAAPVGAAAAAVRAAAGAEGEASAGSAGGSFFAKHGAGVGKYLNVAAAKKAMEAGSASASDAAAPAAAAAAAATASSTTSPPAAAPAAPAPAAAAGMAKQTGRPAKTTFGDFSGW